MGNRGSALSPVCPFPAEVPVVAVVADHGAGKTSLLRGWHRDLADIARRPPIWLDQRDFADTRGLLQRVERFGREAEQITVLVDEFETLSDSSARAALLSLVDRSPHQLVVAAQHGIDLPLHRWRASGSVVEFNTSDLQLEAEAIAFLADERGLELVPDVVGQICERTHGYADAVTTVLDRLVGVAAPLHLGVVDSAVNACALDLAEYLQRSVEEPIFRFMVRTSLLDRVDRQLSSVLDGLDAKNRDISGLDVMAELRRAPFTEPVDSQGQEVAVHPLARLGLQLRLQELESEPQITKLHRATADCLAELGRSREAMDLYLEAGEPRRAADLLLGMWEQDPSGVSDEDIDRLSNAGAIEYVPHMVTQAFGLLRANEFAAARVLRNRLDAEAWTGPISARFGTLQEIVAEIDGALPELTVEHMERYIEWVAEKTAADGRSQPLPNRYTVAHYIYWLGRVAEAGHSAASILVGHRSVGRDTLSEQIITVLACDLQALVNWDLGEAEVAASSVSRSVELLAEYGIDLGAISEPARCVNLLVRAVAGDGPVDDRLDLLHRLTEEAPARELQVHAWIEKICLLDRLHRFDDALESLSLLHAFADDSAVPLIPLHINRLAALDQALRPARGSSGPAMHLTAGERAVLYLLADEALSQTDIAERLGLSINTIKSHLRNVYQKLGVTGRKGAVAEARTRQLLITVDPWITRD